MRISVTVPVVLATAVATAVVGLATVAATAAPPATKYDSTAPAAPSPARTVRLATGQLVAVSHRDGRVIARQLDGSSAATHTASNTPLHTWSVDGHDYVVPAQAQPFLGGALDPSLFDVDTLPAATSHLAVTAAVRSPSVTVPGLTVTSHGAGSETGYFTEAGARQFGAAITQAAVRASRAHRGVRTLFGGMTALATPQAVRPLHPDYPQVTLRLSVLDNLGRPADFAFAALVNVDEGRKFYGFIEVLNGIAKISVPKGHYSAFVEYDVFHDSQNDFSVTPYLVPAAQFDVTTNEQTQVFDAREATSTVSVTTPRPASLVDLSYEWDRTSAGQPFTIGFSSDNGPGTIRVAPSGPVTIGRQRWLVGASLVHAGGAVPYTYDLSFPTDGAITADQSYRPPASGMAKIRSRYFTDTVARNVYFGRAAVYPFQGFAFFGLYPLRAPVARDEYVYAGTGATWADGYQPSGLSFVEDDGLHVYRPGTDYTLDWSRGVLAPGNAPLSPDDDFAFCGACRTSTHVFVSLAPFVDTADDHDGYFFITRPTQTASNFTVYRNGTKVFDRRNYLGVTLPASAAEQTYRVVDTTYRSVAGFRTAAPATTDVTFRTKAGGKEIPGSWYCPIALRCKALPLLNAVLSLPATALDDVEAPGGEDVALRVTHAAGSPAIALTGAKVELSFDGGRSYHAAPITRTGSGTYSVHLFNPAKDVGKPVDTRITVSDAAGGKLVQTVTAAYYVGTSR